jgi:hypothetical protein
MMQRTRVFLRKSQTSGSKLSARGVNSNRADFATENQLADGDSSQDSRNGIMADNGRKNRLFVLPSERAPPSINIVA